MIHPIQHLSEQTLSTFQTVQAGVLKIGVGDETPGLDRE